MTEPDSITLLTEPNAQFRCNGVLHKTQSDSKEIFTYAFSHINLDLNASELVNSNLELFGDKLVRLENKQNKMFNKTGTDKTLSTVFGVHPKHESWLRILLRSLFVIAIIILLLCLIKKSITFAWNKFYKVRNRRYIAHLGTQSSRDNSPTVITTQPTSTNL